MFSVWFIVYLLSTHFFVVYRKNLGGKLGLILTEEMKLKMMGDLAELSLQSLSKAFGEKTGLVLDFTCLAAVELSRNSLINVNLR